MAPPITLPSVTILDAGTTSGVLDFTQGVLAWVRSLAIYAPAHGQTVTVEVSDDNATFVPLQSGGANVTLPQSVATVIHPVAFRFARFVSGVAVTGNQVFQLSGREDGY